MTFRWLLVWCAVGAVGVSSCTFSEPGDAPSDAASPSGSRSKPRPTLDNGDAPTEGGNSTASETSAVGGQVIDYDTFDASLGASGRTVLYFTAPGCAQCEATRRSLELDGVPAGLTVVTVEMSDHANVSSAFAVAAPHTFLLIDAGRREVARWSDTVTSEQIAERAAQ